MLGADTVAWRRNGKTAAEWLAGASEGTEADELELALIRLVQVARKRLSEEFVYLLALYHDLKPFGRGTVCKGATPAKLAGIGLPTDD